MNHFLHTNCNIPLLQSFHIFNKSVILKCQLVMEDSSVEYDLLLLQFTVELIFELLSVMKQHLGQLLHLTLDIEMETSTSGPVLHVKVAFVLILYEEGGSFHLWKGVLQIIMEIVEVEIEVSDTTSWY